MCCDLCNYYTVCSEEDKLRDDCCPRCSDYTECIGVDEFSEEEDLDTF